MSTDILGISLLTGSVCGISYTCRRLALLAHFSARTPRCLEVLEFNKQFLESMSSYFVRPDHGLAVRCFLGLYVPALTAFIILLILGREIGRFQ